MPGCASAPWRLAVATSVLLPMKGVIVHKHHHTGNLANTDQTKILKARPVRYAVGGSGDCGGSYETIPFFAAELPSLPKSTKTLFRQIGAGNRRAN